MEITSASQSYGIAVAPAASISQAQNAFNVVAIGPHRDRPAIGTLVEAQDIERARIARELHDDVGQKLALLGMDLDQMAHTLPSTEHRVRVRELSARITEISRDLDVAPWSTITRDATTTVHRDVSRREHRYANRRMQAP